MGSAIKDKVLFFPALFFALSLKKDMKLSEFEAVRGKVREAVFEHWYFKKCAEEKEKKLKQEEEVERLRKKKEEKQKKVEEQSKE